MSGSSPPGKIQPPEKYLNALDIALEEAAETENWLYKFRHAGFLKKQLVKP